MNVTDGTPEPITAAIVSGFRNVYTIVEDISMMTLPRDEELRAKNVDFMHYESPDENYPNSGVLAALCVRQLAKYIQNYLEKLPLPEIALPTCLGLRTRGFSSFVRPRAHWPARPRARRRDLGRAIGSSPSSCPH